MDIHDLTKEEVIRKIQSYGAKYDLTNPNFDVFEQLLACEAIAESEAEAKKRSVYYPEEKHNEEIKVNVSVNGMVNDTYKRTVNFELTENKLNVILKLKSYTNRTAPIKVSELLDKFFSDSNTKPNHWLYIAQTWPPRRIYLTLKQMLKRQEDGWTTIKTPAAYFTYLIKYRKKRKK